MLVDGEDIYAPGIDAADVRERIGMVFQRPNPFPTMSIWDNVGVGPRLLGVRGAELSDVIESSLRKRRALGRSRRQAAGAGDRALGRPAAAALHRPLHRGRSRR